MGRPRNMVASHGTPSPRVAAAAATVAAADAAFGRFTRLRRTHGVSAAVHALRLEDTEAQRAAETPPSPRRTRKRGGGLATVSAVREAGRVPVKLSEELSGADVPISANGVLALAARGKELSHLHSLGAEGEALAGLSALDAAAVGRCALRFDLKGPRVILSEDGTVATSDTGCRGMQSAVCGGAEMRQGVHYVEVTLRTGGGMVGVVGPGFCPLGSGHRAVWDGAWGTRRIPGVTFARGTAAESAQGFMYDSGNGRLYHVSPPPPAG